jgi:hypothetical protein
MRPLTVILVLEFAFHPLKLAKAQNTGTTSAERNASRGSSSCAQKSLRFVRLQAGICTTQSANGYIGVYAH